MIRTTVIGTCIFCLKLKAVRLRPEEKRYVPGRREGVCEECEHKLPKERPKLKVNYDKKEGGGSTQRLN